MSSRLLLGEVLIVPIPNNAADVLLGSHVVITAKCFNSQAPIWFALRRTGGNHLPGDEDDARPKNDLIVYPNLSHRTPFDGRRGVE